MADEDENVCMPVDDWDYVAEDSDEDDNDRGRGENENMDDLGEDVSDEEVNNDDEEDESDDGIESDDDDEEEEEVHDEIVNKFIGTFHNGDYDQEFDDALSSDRSVPSTTHPTQASYNKPGDWKERNQIGLERLKEQLQNLTDLVSHDQSFQLRLTHNMPWNQLVDNEEPIVWHEPILDRNWDVLEAEIDRMRLLDRVADIKQIQIVNIEMKKERLAALVVILSSGRANSSSTYIEFNNANLCGDGIMYLSGLIETSPMLRDFRLHHNRIDSMESARCLSRSLKSHTRINQLYLTDCNLGSTPEIIMVILQSNIEHMILDDNNIDSLGAVKIAEYIGSNTPIYRIDLDRNRLNDDDASLISQALKRNTHLGQIDLFANNITSIGVKALLTCVFNSSSLNAISESNHTLGGMNMFLQGNNDRLQDCIDKLLNLNRTQNIIAALQDRDSLLQYLANIPVQLIPEVLSFPLQNWIFNGVLDDDFLVGQEKHLNIVYSTMRWWNMPLLYSYYNCAKSDTKRKRKIK
jgi:hypothetical protein